MTIGEAEDPLSTSAIAKTDEAICQVFTLIPNIRGMQNPP